MQDGRIIEVATTVEDTIAFTIPWSARAQYVPVRDTTFLQIACAESQREFWLGR